MIVWKTIKVFVMTVLKWTGEKKNTTLLYIQMWIVLIKVLLLQNDYKKIFSTKNKNNKIFIFIPCFYVLAGTTITLGW